jgi:phosphoribosylglycinamide formyltransferase 2
MVSLLRELATPLSGESFKLMFLGSGELGKEMILEAHRLGLETIAVDRYPDAPGMQVAHKNYTMNMMDESALWNVVYREKPDVIVPEIEAINTDMLFEFEKEGFFVVPNAKATWIAMNRERMRELITSTGVNTSKYAYATTEDELLDACESIGYPCVSKAIMSSSGKGSYFIQGPEDVPKAFEEARTKARVPAKKIIVEEFVDFDVEITALSVRHLDQDGNETKTFVRPIGHYQIQGDYHSSWHPWAEGQEELEEQIYEYSEKIMTALGGYGIFAHEMFVSLKDGKIYANETACRPHDTGLVTIYSMPVGYSEFALHVKAISGIPIFSDTPGRVIHPVRPSASHVILSHGEGWYPKYHIKYRTGDSTILFFGKPESYKNRRMGVVLSAGKSIEDAMVKAEKAAHMVEVEVGGSRYRQEMWDKHVTRE